MSFLRLPVTAIALAALTVPALAVCPICNSSVRFDSNLASCFSKRIEAEIERLRREGNGFVIVNLSDCPASQIRQALPTTTRAGSPPPQLDSSFVADDVALRCLGEAIASHKGPMDPSVVFDLAQICT